MRPGVRQRNDRNLLARQPAIARRRRGEARRIADAAGGPGADRRGSRDRARAQHRRQPAQRCRSGGNPRRGAGRGGARGAARGRREPARAARQVQFRDRRGRPLAARRCRGGCAVRGFRRGGGGAVRGSAGRRAPPPTPPRREGVRRRSPPLPVLAGRGRGWGGRPRARSSLSKTSPKPPPVSLAPS